MNAIMNIVKIPSKVEIVNMGLRKFRKSAIDPKIGASSATDAVAIEFE